MLKELSERNMLCQQMDEWSSWAYRGRTKQNQNLDLNLLPWTNSHWMIDQNGKYKKLLKSFKENIWEKLHNLHLGEEFTKHDTEE